MAYADAIRPIVNTYERAIAQYTLEVAQIQSAADTNPWQSTTDLNLDSAKYIAEAPRTYTSLSAHLCFNFLQ